MKGKMKTAILSRRKQTQRMMLGLGLATRLHNLADEIMNTPDKPTGAQLAEFQQLIQSAPRKLRERLLEQILALESCPIDEIGKEIAKARERLA